MTIRATQKKRISPPVSRSVFGKNRFISLVADGQSNTEKGKRPEIVARHFFVRIDYITRTRREPRIKNIIVLLQSDATVIKIGETGISYRQRFFESPENRDVKNSDIVERRITAPLPSSACRRARPDGERDQLRYDMQEYDVPTTADSHDNFVIN